MYSLRKLETNSVQHCLIFAQIIMMFCTSQDLLGEQVSWSSICSTQWTHEIVRLTNVIDDLTTILLPAGFPVHGNSEGVG